jgi:hypothetical protein
VQLWTSVWTGQLCKSEFAVPHMVVDRGRLSVCQLYVRLQLAPLFQTDYAISFVERIPARKTYLQHAVSSTTLPDFFFVITKSPNIA